MERYDLDWYIKYINKDEEKRMLFKEICVKGLNLKFIDETEDTVVIKVSRSIDIIMPIIVTKYKNNNILIKKDIKNNRFEINID